MDKETIKRIINEIIDSADEIKDFSMSADIEEIDRSTLDSEYVEYRPTGMQHIHLAIYKKVD